MNAKSNKLNILIAYPYFKKDVIKFLESQPRNSYRLIVDSGAFTAWNTGKVITMQGYCEFLDSIKHLRPFHAVSFDVFGDAKASWENYLEMKNNGYEEMPVFTRGESIEKLDEMYEHTDYIMFGGIVIGRGNRGYVRWFEERNKGRKIHWLGFVDIPFIKYYKPTSVDSSSWRSSARFGNIPLYKGGGELKSYKKSVFAKPLTAEMKTFAKSIGVTPRELSILRYKESWIDSGTHDADLDIDKERKNTSAQFIGTLSHIVRGREVEKNIGTKIYLAVATKSHLDLVFKAKNFLDSRGIK